jgi:hypothetical protein
MLELKPTHQLNDAGIASRTDTPECAGTAHIIARLIEVDVSRQVEGLGGSGCYNILVGM